jgi:LPS sulfotransferase NodH
LLPDASGKILDTAMRGYAICATQRSGSNYFGQLLASTGVLGFPREYFNAAGRRAIDDDPTYPDAPSEQIERILTKGATPNGIYALKLFPHQHDLIVGKVFWSEALPDLRFVLLERRDLLGQAISLHRAKGTAQARSNQPIQAPPVYDAGSIERCLRKIVRERARWEQFFARNGLNPLRTVYEDLVEHPLVTVESVAKLMEVGEPVRLEPRTVDLAIQRDGLSEEWRARFLAERRNLDRIDPI